MGEHYPSPSEPEPRSLRRKLGRAAFAGGMVTLTLAAGTAGGYGLAKLVTEELDPAVQHATDNLLNDVLGGSTGGEQLVTPQASPASTQRTREP
jgi:hypothetical protein